MTDYELLEKLVRKKINVTERHEKELALLAQAPNFIPKAFLQAYQHIIINGNSPALVPVNECHSQIAVDLGLTTSPVGNTSFHYPVNPGDLPDIDTDFAFPAQVKEYISNTYGADKVVGIPTYGRYKVKSLLNDLCRVIVDEDGEPVVPPEEVKALNKKLPFKIDAQIAGDMADEDIIEEDGMNDDEIFTNTDIQDFQKKFPQVFEHFKLLYALPKYRGQHAAGVVILPEAARDTLPLSLTKKNICTEWIEGQGVNELGSVGVIKVDILGLKTLKVLDTCNKLIMARYPLDDDTPSPCSCKKQDKPCKTNYKMPFLIRQATGERLINFNALCLNIPKVYKAIGNYETQGVFQFEPEGISAFTHKYNPKEFYDLALITALYRPGPLDARLDDKGMPIDPELPEYKKATSAAIQFIERHNGQAKVYYASPKLEDVLKKNYGIAVFQEDISRIVMKMTGCEFAEAEKIRKFLTKVKPELVKTDPDTIAKLKSFEDKFTKQSLEQGASKVEIEGVWNLIVPFARYGFNKCISGDTLVMRSSGNQFCKKEVTVRELFDAQESKTSIGKKMRLYGIKIMQMSSDGKIRPGKLKKIYYSGIQNVFEVKTEDGKSIKVTNNHRLLTNKGYQETNMLKIGDSLVVQGENSSDYSRKTYVSAGKLLKTEGHWNENENNGNYIDGRSVAYREAITKLSRTFCQACHKLNNNSTKHAFEIAHIKSFQECNSDWLEYNNLTNLKYLCNSCHKKIDFKKGERKIRFTHGKNIKLEKITSIEHVGLEPTYDIEMDTEEHNFLANKIVSHNSHAWTYSLISFQTAFCRTLFPLEFLTSLMIHNVHNTAGKDKVIEYIRTAQKLEYKVLAPDINLSDVNFTINEENQIVSGLTMINRVGEKASNFIVQNRKEFGPFTSIEDFLSRKIVWRTVKIDVLEALVNSGAFDSIAPNRKLAWAKIQINKKKAKIEDFEQVEIGSDENDNPIKEIYVEDFSNKEKITFEREYFGFLLEDYVTKNKAQIERYRKTLRTIAIQKKKQETIGTIEDIKVMNQKNGEKYARITATNIDGIKEQWLIFSSVWKVYKNSIKVFETYFALGKKDDRSFLVDSIQPLDDVIKITEE